MNRAFADDVMLATPKLRKVWDSVYPWAFKMKKKYQPERILAVLRTMDREVKEEDQISSSVYYGMATNRIKKTYENVAQEEKNIMEEVVKDFLRGVVNIE